MTIVQRLIPLVLVIAALVAVAATKPGGPELNRPGGYGSREMQASYASHAATRGAPAVPVAPYGYRPAPLSAASTHYHYARPHRKDVHHNPFKCSSMYCPCRDHHRFKYYRKLPPHFLPNYGYHDTQWKPFGSDPYCSTVASPPWAYDAGAAPIGGPVYGVDPYQYETYESYDPYGNGEIPPGGETDFYDPPLESAGDVLPDTPQTDSQLDETSVPLRQPF